jgi:hypothetical protein
MFARRSETQLLKLVNLMPIVFADATMSGAQVFEWFHHFKG